jgi:hypothetical protein
MPDYSTVLMAGIRESKHDLDEFIDSVLNRPSFLQRPVSVSS